MKYDKLLIPGNQSYLVATYGTNMTIDYDLESGVNNELISIVKNKVLF